MFCLSYIFRKKNFFFKYYFSSILTIYSGSSEARWANKEKHFVFICSKWERKNYFYFSRKNVEKHKQAVEKNVFCVGENGGDDLEQVWLGMLEKTASKW